MKLTENLRLFNTKERFYLIRKTLGNNNFIIENTFREELNRKFTDLNLQKNETHYFAAMDYHIDWIYASLYMTYGTFTQDGIPRVGNTIEGTQEDIDFLICIDRKDRGVEKSHIILLEAKGVTGWSNEQMKRKAERFGQIFGDDYGSAWKNDVKPYFALVSTYQPTKKFKTDTWPAWMKAKDGKPIIIDLGIGEYLRADDNLRKVTRCDKGNPPKSNKSGEFWTIKNLSKGNF